MFNHSIPDYLTDLTKPADAEELGSIASTAKSDQDLLPAVALSDATAAELSRAFMKHIHERDSAIENFVSILLVFCLRRDCS
jgi:hypothetical protein